MLKEAHPMQAPGRTDTETKFHCGNVSVFLTNFFHKPKNRTVYLLNLSNRLMCSLLERIARRGQTFEASLKFSLFQLEVLTKNF